MDGPSASATFHHSFRQPDDAEDEDNDGESDLTDEVSEDGQGKATNEVNTLEAQSTVVEVANNSNTAVSSEDEPAESNVKRRSTFREKFSPKSSKHSPTRTSFVTAPTKEKSKFRSKLAAVDSEPATSFITARESPGPSKISKQKPDQGGNEQNPDIETTQSRPGLSAASSSRGLQPRSSAGDVAANGNATNSTASLIPHNASNTGGDDGSSPNLHAKVPVHPTETGQDPTPQAKATGLVKFNLDGTPDHTNTRPATKTDPAGRRRSWKRFRHGELSPGQIVKMEKMLVRVDSTMQELPPDYDENDSLKMEARMVDKWREFVVVCRESTNGEAAFSIQMYKSRNNPAKEMTHVKKRSTHEIPLSRKTTHVNLYSALDKTLVIWVPWKMGTMMYILRTRSAASAVEWHTFIRNCLGWQRPTTLQVNVPDLSVTLQLENPFAELEASMSASQSVSADFAAINKTMVAERAVASTIIQRSLKMLGNNPEWANVLEEWLAKEKIGLAWKRYDRLEWVHGANEQRMYGSLAMQRTHELELRPKDHYPTAVKTKDAKSVKEPAPVEGFLIRLTSQKGHVRRLGKMYFKRLYFTTHNQFLCYCRPAKALPPPPPELPLQENHRLRTRSEILEMTPLIFAVNPFPEHDGEIEWLQQGAPVSQKRHNEYAYKESERKINTLLEAEGYINLSHVVRVQHAQRGNSPADANVDEGPDVDFHEEVANTTRDDGKTNQFDDDRTLELVMKNSLVIRLQAYNRDTKDEWIKRLRKLVEYWKLRLANDMELLKAVRGSNLKRLDINEEFEAYVGQYGSKWEVTRSVASPKLFNMCGIACCRAITVSLHLL